MFGFSGGFGGKAASKESTGRAHTSTSKESTGRAHSSTPSKAAEKGGRVGGPSADKGDRVGSTDTGRFGGGSYNASNGSKAKSRTGTDTGRFGGGSSNPTRGFSAAGDPSRFGGRSSSQSTPTGMRSDEVGVRGRDPTRFGDSGLTDFESRLSRTVSAGPGSFSVEGAIRSALGFGDTPTRGFGAAMGADAKEKDRSLSVGIDPTRFGGGLSTADKGDRLGSPTRGSTAPERSYRESEIGSMRSLDRSAEMERASQARAAENASMDRYNAAAAVSEANALRADTASSIRAAENTSMKDMATWGRQVKSVTAAGPGWTNVELNDGTVEHRKGDRAARNNNPGNMEYGPYAKSMGAVGTDGRFAVFGSKEDGVKAVEGWYAKEAKKNPNITLGQAISKYAPEFENDTRAYTAALAKAGGISPDTKVTDITPDQMSAMLNAQYSVEGNTGYKMAEVSPRTKDYGDVRSYPDKATQFASTYLGKDQKQAQEDYFGSVPQKGGYAAANEKALKDQEAVRTASVSPPAESVSYAPDPSLTEFPDRPRSNTEKVIAGALDFGGSLIPGVGIGVGLINGGLSLTGSRTIGDRIVDAVVTGDGKYTPRELGDPNRPTVVADSTTVPHKTVPTVESFVDTYLNPPDKTKYPTPYQRYDLGRDTYAGV